MLFELPTGFHEYMSKKSPSTFCIVQFVSRSSEDKKQDAGREEGSEGEMFFESGDEAAASILCFNVSVEAFNLQRFADQVCCYPGIHGS